MPLKYSSLLQSLIDWTDIEINLGKKFLDWEEILIKWNDLNLHWEDIFILIERRGGGSGTPYKDEKRIYEEGNPWRKMAQSIGEEKIENIIKVICKVNNIEYEKILENKENIRIIVNEFIRAEYKNDIKIKVKF